MQSLTRFRNKDVKTETQAPEYFSKRDYYMYSPTGTRGIHAGSERQEFPSNDNIFPNPSEKVEMYCERRNQSSDAGTGDKLPPKLPN